MSLSFLSPLFLWALPLAAGPVLLHWLTRSKPRLLLFSYNELLKKAAFAQSSRARLKNWILLAARCLLIAAAVLFFARPLLHWSLFEGGRGTGMTTVLVLDASGSMGAVDKGWTAFDRAKASAAELLGRSRRGDKWGLVVYSDRVELEMAPIDDVARVRAAIENVSPTFRTTNLGPALLSAGRLLSAQKEGARAAVILSDLARNGLSAMSPAEGDEAAGYFGKTTGLLFCESAPEEPNGALVGVSLSGGAGGSIEGYLLERRWGAAAEPRRFFRILGGGRTLSQGTLAADQGPGSKFDLRGGDAWAEARADADAWPADDVFYFPLGAVSPARVLVVNGAPGLIPVKDEAYYFSALLKSLAAKGVSFKTVTAAAFPKEDVALWDVIVLANVGAVAGDSLALLQRHMNAGGGLLVTTGDQVRWQGSLGGLLPGELGPPIEGSAAAAPAATGAGPDALSQALSEGGGFEWAQARLSASHSFAPARGSRVYVERKDGKGPLLVVGNALRGRAAVWLTSLDRDWTNLPAKPVFPVLFGSLIAELSRRGNASVSASLKVGEAFTAPWLDGWGESLTVERPDGGKDAVKRAPRLVYDNTSGPGAYLLRGADGQARASFLVNVDAEREGDPARLTRDDLEKAFPGAALGWVRHPETALEAFEKRVRGKDLTAHLITAALAFFALESVLAAVWKS